MLDLFFPTEHPSSTRETLRVRSFWLLSTSRHPFRRASKSTLHWRGTQTSIIKTARGVESASNQIETRGRSKPRRTNFKEKKISLSTAEDAIDPEVLRLPF
jgi:hypothetical protein